MAQIARRVSFRTAIFLVALLAATWMCTWPVVQSFWAEKMWTRTPCWLMPNGQAFFYAVGGHRFASSRLNFWKSKYNSDPLKETPGEASPHNDEVPNDFCWVSPNEPTHSVLRLDVQSTIGDGTNRFVTSGLLMTATAGICLFGFRRKLSSSGAAMYSQERKGR